MFRNITNFICFFFDNEYLHLEVHFTDGILQKMVFDRE